MIESIDLRYIRCYEHIHVDLEPSINLFFGKNGVGKTTILEAAHAMSSLHSFKASYIYELIQSGLEAGKIQIQLTNQNRLSFEIRKRKKTLMINESKVNVQKEFVGQFSTIILAPEHVKIIDGNKKQRQGFLDDILVQTDSGYRQTLKNHNKVLTQKRALLQQDLPKTVFMDQMGVWHEQNKTLTQNIRETRTSLLHTLQPIFSQTYQEVSKTNTALQVLYQPCDDHAPLDQDLLEQEYYAKRVMFGAQRDDLSITLDQRSSQKHASQGEKATILLGMKLAELKILEKHNKKPIFLLDDVGTTLDKERRKMLFEKLDTLSCQSLVSTCDPFIQEEIASKHANTRLFFYDSKQKNWV